MSTQRWLGLAFVGLFLTILLLQSVGIIADHLWAPFLPMTVFGTALVAVLVMHKGESVLHKDPFTIPESTGTDLHPYLRRKPEFLFSLACVFNTPEIRSEIRRATGVKPPRGEWEMYDFLLRADGKRWDELNLVVAGLASEARDELEVPQQVTPGQFAKVIQRNFDSAFDKYFREEIDLNALLWGIAAIWGSESNNREALLERLRGKIGRVIRAEYAEAVLESNGHASGGSIADWVTEYRRGMNRLQKMRRANTINKDPVKEHDESPAIQEF